LIPFHLYFFCIESLSHFALSLFLWAAILIVAALISLLVFEIKRRRGSLALYDWVYIKHRMLLLTVILSSLLFLQTYLAIGVIIFFLFWSPTCLEADFRILQLEEYPTRQRPAERRRNRELIELASCVQVSTGGESTRDFMERYRNTRKKIAASEAEIFSKRSTFKKPRIGDQILTAALLGSLAIFGKVLALFPLPLISHDAAIGFPLIFLMVNAILEALVFFGGLIYGSIRWEAHSPSSHRYRLTVSLILLTILFVILIVIASLGLY